ncbi:hypothetical protein B7P34_12770 [Streptosporangium nondiastaticum]|uniref:Uncharacterized protein n=2 Tax=Actinomycetes TaxID=1760 RepID=A0A9X7JR81_9ACTN|nr:MULTISPECIES: hypothetical protein [Actinomycetes]PSJ28362.1 hypothetical protein B7P34_12770 [Streptosporangium nondiastaticum]WKU48312.1 hypothetical protein Q3V23_31965 [Streptomyces sp. VNUA116]
MDRGSSKHGAKRDDELKREVQELTRSGRPTRTEEWRDAEPLTPEEPAAEPGAQPRRERP